MSAEKGDRFRTESGREFTLLERKPNLEPGWVLEWTKGGRDWISDWQLSHCTKVASPTDRRGDG